MEKYEQEEWLPEHGFAEREISRVGYMCITEFECELGFAKGGNTVFPSVEDLKEKLKCADECGIVKVRVSEVEIIQEPSSELY